MYPSHCFIWASYCFIRSLQRNPTLNSDKDLAFYIYDEQKNELQRALSIQNKAVLSVQKIKSGLYYLHIFSEAGILREKIVVNH